jgi:alpha-N-arabinofuranosidase
VLTLSKDINNSGDGGIYAELIQNRAFQYSRNYSVSTAHYFPINGADLSIQNLSQPLSKALPASMRVAAGNGTGKIGFKNEGYWGMDVKQQKYTGSFWVKGDYEGSFTASLESNLTSDVFGSVDVPSKSVAGDWTEHSFELTPEMDAPNSNNTFSITFDSSGSSSGALDFNLISLFPPTYKNRKNGLRVDIAEALADMNPASLVTSTTQRGTDIIFSLSFVSRAVICLRVSRMIHTGTGRTQLVLLGTAQASRACGVTSKQTVWD